MVQVPSVVESHWMVPEVIVLRRAVTWVYRVDGRPSPLKLVVN